MIEIVTPRTLRYSGLLLTSLFASSAFAANSEAFWQDLPYPPKHSEKTALKQPSQLRTLTLDFADLKTELDTIGVARSDANSRGQKVKNPTATLAMPLPEGGFTEFLITDSGTIPPQLAQKYPDIRSFKGSDGQGRNLRLDISAQGMKAMVFDPKGAWLVQPAETLGGGVNYAKASGDQYWSFRRNALPATKEPFKEKILNSTQAPQHSHPHSDAEKNNIKARAITGNVRRDYRIAIAATSDYTARFGGTVAGGLAAVSHMLNRINEIYERDFGVHLTLIADNDKIIYTDLATDPYQDGDILEQNVANLNKVIGQANFDVGHVVSIGDGGIVGRLGSTCVNTLDLNNKAAGTTGRDNPVGDPFYVDFVAHELGHQFGAWHTHNSCGGGIGTFPYMSTLPASAIEPGSGSTIMAYAGLCDDTENLQNHSDPYFHASSIDQVHAWISGKGGSCAVKRINTNDAPWIDPESMPGGGFRTLTIPANTPFVLNGEASGNVDAVLTYSWEQFDAHPGRTVLRDDGKGPIFRSYLPNTSGERVFPRMAAVLGDEPLGNGEVYPVTNRTLTFRLTARDNLDTQATTASADTTINVLNTGRPFAVTRPNKIVGFKGGSKQVIRWDVAKTDKAPISCNKVRIDLSVDGGYTYLTRPLAEAVPNNGAARISMPRLNESTSKARLKIKCLDNVFFAVSPTNFVIR
ncbi:reprolysin-like metallopeptidase [Glaciimonas sp. GG7]